MRVSEWLLKFYIVNEKKMKEGEKGKSELNKYTIKITTDISMGK